MNLHTLPHSLLTSAAVQFGTQFAALAVAGLQIRSRYENIAGLHTSQLTYKDTATDG